MLNSRHRLLTIALAVGGLTMLGTAGALATVDVPGSAPGGNNPVCTAPHSPLASTPACASHQDLAQPAVAAESGAGVQADPPEGGEAPGPTHPFCEGGSPLLGSPLCPSKWPPS